MPSKRKILIFCDYYLPGFRAGGPITSIHNIVNNLAGHFDFYIVTRDHDYLSAEQYSIARERGFVTVGQAKVMYCKAQNMAIKEILKIVSEVSPDDIYLNSLFSLPFSIKVLLARRISPKTFPKIVLCPRGELNDSALSKGYIKKRLFLAISSMVGLRNNIDFHATNEREKNQVITKLNATNNVTTLGNLGRMPDQELTFNALTKTKGELKLVFVGRLNRIKNLRFLVDVLATMNHKIELSIIGPDDEHEETKRIRQQITKLSSNISVKLLGDMPHREAIKKIREHHLLVLPSKGENFGQVIFEALSVGRPVLISDQTPWQNLTVDGVGWDLPLGNLNLWSETLSLLVQMEDLEWKAHSKSALEFAKKYMIDQSLVQHYREFFEKSYCSS